MGKKVVVLFGGSGALGRTVLKQFQKNFNVLNIDFNKNDDAGEEIILKQNSLANDNIRIIKNKLNSLTNEYTVKSVISVAGGFEMVGVESEDIFDSTNHMFNINCISSLMAGHIASHFLEKNGNLILTGASSPFFEPQPNMLSYALTKNFVHNLAFNLNEEESFKGKSVLTILPTVIDTEMNRRDMPDADFSTWIPPLKLAELLFMWNTSKNKPKSGSYVNLKYDKETIITSLH